MSRRSSSGNGVTAVLFLLALSAVCPGWAEDDAGLFVSSLAIQERSDGAIQVKARCVQAQELLDQLAKRAGKTVQLPGALLNYVSLDAGGTWEPAEWWLSRLLDRCLCNMDRCNDPVWKGTFTSYDPSLDEAAVKRLHASAAPAQVKRGQGGKGGVLANGRYVTPPYQVSFERTSKTTGQVCLNGLVMKELKQDAAPTRDPWGTVCELPESGQFVSAHDLLGYVCNTLYPAELAKGGQDKAREQVIQFLGSQDIVERIVYPESLESLAASFSRDFRGYLTVFPADYDFAKGRLRPSAPRPEKRQTLEERGRKEADALADAIKGPYLHVLCGTDAQFTVTKPEVLSRIADVCSQATALGPLKAECLLVECGFDPIMARSVAANLDTDGTVISQACRKLLSNQ